MNKLITIALALALAPAAGTVFAQVTPVGLWKTIDDKTGKERSHVRITESAGVLSGRVEKRLDPNAKPEDVCDKCSDDRKGQTLQGLEIIRSVKKSEGEADLWDGGTVLDPEEGKIYKVRLKPVDGGKKLELRGYIGLPLLGRTQTWIRAE